MTKLILIILLVLLLILCTLIYFHRREKKTKLNLEEYLYRLDIPHSLVDQILSQKQTDVLSFLRNTMQPVYDNKVSLHQTIMIVGVNGVGKTTSIAKLANYFIKKNKTVVLGAADTFRAAAVPQLMTWGKRLQVEVISDNKSPSGVAAKTIEYAKNNKIDITIIDTAGRMHSSSNLMEELKKLKRTIEHLTDNLSIILVVDSLTGYNAINQVLEFNNALGLNGIILTKYDAMKSTTPIGISINTKLPILFLGTGEQIDDFQEFELSDYLKALLID